jgi:pilus assembly protein CpaB
VGRRLGLLITAVVVAALGTAMVFLYVRGANDRALRGTNPHEVLVATSQISAGTSVQDAAQRGAFERKALPKVAIAAGAVSNVNPIQGKVALTTIFPGQQVLEQMFGDNPAAAGPFDLPAGSLAVSFSFDDPNRVAGYVQPGSQVAVFVAEEAADRALVLLPRTQVLAVGPPAPSSAAGTSSGGRRNGSATGNESSRALVTLALNQEEALKMILAESRGTLYLGLLGAESKVTPSAGVTGAKLYN